MDRLFYRYSFLYQEAFNKIKKNLPVNMRSYLDSFLVRGKLTAQGSFFPRINFVNTKISPNSIYHNKFTLIDFWFYKCRPCLRQFKSLKDVYDKNYTKGFDIVAISIDKESDIPEYMKLIKVNEYKWKQVLDTGGIEANSININRYPSTFLLDQTGKIIAVDVQAFALEDFLRKNL